MRALTDGVAQRTRVAEATAPDVQPGRHHRLHTARSRNSRGGG